MIVIRITLIFKFFYTVLYSSFHSIPHAFLKKFVDFFNFHNIHLFDVMPSQHPKVIRIKAKKAFTPTKIPGAKYVINQYIGCQHACSYCYAKFLCKRYNHGEWGTWVIVKENLPQLVKHEHPNGRVYMSSVSDPYQPLETKLKLTRKSLENLDKTTHISILTKSNLIVSDIDLLKLFPNLEAGLTINDYSGELKKVLEPFSPTNERRIEALKVLNEYHIKTYTFVSPIIPELTDVEQIVKQTKSFSDFFWFELLNLKVTDSDFKTWLKDSYPKSYQTLTNNYLLQQYVSKLKAEIKKLTVPTKGLVTHSPKFSVLTV